MQHDDIALEREGEGRYAVKTRGNRAGLVLGGGNKWAAETPAGTTLGTFKTRAQAVDALTADAQMWAPMEQAARQEGLPRFYRSDFEIDRAEIRRWEGTTDFLWMLRESGTNLLALNAGWAYEDMAYRLELYVREGTPFVCFLVLAHSQPGTIKKITAKKAQDILSHKAPFSISTHDRSVVNAQGGRIATLDVTDYKPSSGPSGIVNVRLVPEAQPCTITVKAVMDSAFRWLCHHAGSLFATPQKVRVLHHEAVVAEI